MTQVSIYDLDETITRRPTFARWLLWWGRRRAPWRLPLLAAQGLATLGFITGAGETGAAGRAQLKSYGLRLILGHARRKVVEAEARAFAAAELNGNTLAGALAQVAADRAEGRRLVLATASMDLYADAIGAALGFDAVIATRAAWADGRLSGLAGPNCYGAGKLATVQAWAAANRIAPADCRVYSDHASDTPLLAWAGEAVAINPAPAFAREAAAQGWRVERWR